MRPCIRLILSLICVAIFIPSSHLVAAGEGNMRRYPCVFAPLKGDILNSRIWDFSAQWVSGERSATAVRIYGDSLLAETVEKRRCWYEMKSDSLYFIGEEDLLTKLSLHTPAAVSALRPAAGYVNDGSRYTATGSGAGKCFDLRLDGTLEFSVSPECGTLILSSADTVRNAMLSRELRYVSGYITTDSVAPPTVYTVEIYRWHARGSLLPLAIQQSVYVSTAGTQAVPDDAPAVSAAYLPDIDVETIEVCVETDSDNQPQYDLQALADALSSAKVFCDGRNVTVDVTLPESGLTVTIDIMDASGRLYLHNAMQSSGQTDRTVLDCSSLRSGEYIAAIGISEVAISPEKQIIIIR